MWDFDFELEEGGSTGRPPPAYTYTASPPKRTKKVPSKVRNREARRRAATQQGELSSSEAEFLEAQLGVAPAELPSHLRSYALQRRNEACFSGPALLPGETEWGAVEYKLRLADPTPTRFQQLVTQLNWRLSEGGGACLYAVGVEDNGHPLGLSDAELAASLSVLRAMAAEVAAQAELLQTPPGSGEGRRCAVVRVLRSAAADPAYTDLRVAVAGGVDSGKSTLVAVLCHGGGGGGPLLDNGRGSSRTAVFRHKHEILSGHTSSISLHTTAYGASGAVLNYNAGMAGLSPPEVAAAAARMVHFSDLGGHERFSKTALHGLTAMLPDYVMVCVSAAAGVSSVTREHLAVALALGVPLFVALTKCDLAGEAAVQRVVQEMRELLAAAVRQGGSEEGSPGALAPLVRSEEQAAELAAGMMHSRITAPGAGLCVPLFPTSSVTGASLQLLHSFLNALQPASSCPAAAASGAMQGWCRPAAGGAAGGSPCSPRAASEAEQGGSQAGASGALFQIDRTYEVAGVGTVYGGTVVCGRIALGQQLLLGPLEGGTFRRVAVSGIHRSKVDVRSVQQGQHATLAVQAAAELAPGGADGGAGACTQAGHAAMAAPAHAQLRLHAGSESSLHAWMQEASRQGSGEVGAGSEGSGSAAAGAAAQQPAQPGTAAMDIQRSAGSALPPAAHTSQPSAAAQLAGWQQRALPAGSAELLPSWGSSPRLVPTGSHPAPRPRKGAVLLHPALQPQPCHQFEAVLVLLGGHWPPRSLLSGRYPPEGELDELDPALGSSPGGGNSSFGGGGGSSSVLFPAGSSPAGSDSGGDSAVAGRSGSFGGRSQSLGRLHRAGSRRRGTSYIPVVHCGSIRQSAHVVAMRELPRPGASGWVPHGTAGSRGSSSSQGAGSECLGGEAGEDPFAALQPGELLTEPSDSSSCCAAAAPAGSSEQSEQQADMCQLAGAVAAAGVLLPRGGGPSSGSTAAAASGRTGPASGCEGGCLAAVSALPAAGGCSPGQQRRALERQRSLPACEDIGCVSAVTFRFMHQPEWLVEGARLIVRDRTTGRVAGAGYVAATHPQAD